MQIIPTTADELQAVYQRLLTEDRRGAAEVAFALAAIHRDRGDKARAGGWASTCIDILSQLPAETPGDCASRNLSLCGVPIPELLHEDVVRAAFSDVL